MEGDVLYPRVEVEPGRRSGLGAGAPAPSMSERGHRSGAGGRPAGKAAAADGGVAERMRFTRERGHHGPSLVERIAEEMDRLHFRSPFHRMRLKGRFPLKLLGVPEDPVPGDPKAGQRLKAGRLFHAGFGQAIAEVRFDDPAAPPEWRAWVHGWGWLRDAAAAAPLIRSETARLEALARRWLLAFPDYHPEAWAPEATGRRVLMAVSHAPLLLSGHDHVFRSLVLTAVARWTRHLERAVPRMGAGLAQVEAAAGLAGGQLILPGNEPRIDRALLLLDRSVAALVGPDGAIATRCPLDLAEVGDLLLHVAAFHRARAQQVAEPVMRHLAAVRAGLSALAEGDGVPAPWHGGQPSAAQVARLLPADDGGKPAPPAASGFRCLAAGETRVLIDAGPPPPLRTSGHAHASTLALTMSDGRHPLLVCCGAARGWAGAGRPRRLAAELAEGLATTAAHCALVVADTNSTRLAAGGLRPAGGVREVEVEARASAEGQSVEARHDGWRQRFGLDHRRRLWLSPDGTDLRGEDMLLAARRGAFRLAAPAALPVAVRFHLAPGCEAAPTQDGMGVFVRTAWGTAWSFRASFPDQPGRVAIEPSVHVDPEGVVRPTVQILLETRTGTGRETRIGWSFRRGSAPRAVPLRRRA